LEAPWQFLTELKRVLRLPHRKLSLDTEKKQMLITEMGKNINRTTADAFREKSYGIS
jgi:hypothetical protein